MDGISVGEIDGITEGVELLTLLGKLEGLFDGVKLGASEGIELGPGQKSD